MRFASWNVHGINKSPHQKELQHFISMNNIELIEVLETKVKVSNALEISKKINKNWQWLFNYDHHYNGRVWVGWNSNVRSISLSNVLLVMLCLLKNINIIVSFVYAFNDKIDRVPFWDYCLSLSNTFFP